MPSGPLVIKVQEMLLVMVMLGGVVPAVQFFINVLHDHQQEEIRNLGSKVKMNIEMTENDSETRARIMMG